MKPADIKAPFEIRDVLTGRELRDGEFYFVLRFADGTERQSVAVFRWDPIGVRQQLAAMGYRPDFEPLRARRAA